MSGKDLVRLVTRLCGPPLRISGSHRTFQGRAGNHFVVAFHDSDNVTGNLVRKILLVDIGLTKQEARKEV